MAAMIHLDTHVMVWLYSGEPEKLSSTAKKMLDEHALRISPMALLELQYLYEIDRVTKSAKQVVDELGRLIGLDVFAAPFNAVGHEALKLSWTRDPFDRLIVASAIVDNARLLTADKLIHEHFPSAVW